MDKIDPDVENVDIEEVDKEFKNYTFWIAETEHVKTKHNSRQKRSYATFTGLEAGVEYTVTVKGDSIHTYTVTANGDGRIHIKFQDARLRRLAEGRVEISEPLDYNPTVTIEETGQKLELSY